MDLTSMDLPALPPDSFIKNYFSSNEPDLEIQIGEKKIKVHKIILTTHSEVFRDMLKNCKDCETITIDCDLGTFNLLLSILHHKYTLHELTELGWLPFIKLTNLLDYYNFEELIKISHNVFKTCTIPNESIFYIYKEMKCKCIKKDCLVEICMAFKFHRFSNKILEIISSSDMMQFMIDYKGQSECTMLPESELCEIIYHWRNINNSKNVADIEMNTIASRNMLKLLDLTKFRLSELTKHMHDLYKDLGEDFISVLFQKLDVKQKTPYHLDC